MTWVEDDDFPGADTILRRSAESWIRELASVVDHINCGLVGRDAKGRITFANERLLGWLGYSLRDLVGRDVKTLVPPELREATKREIEATEKEGDLRARLSALQRSDSTTFPAIIIPHPYQDETGTFAGIVSVIIDLGTIQTAKRVGVSNGIAAELGRIAMELHSLSLVSEMDAADPAALRHPALDTLSTREREVLSHLLSGARVPAISERLHISPHTVRNHLKSIYRKLDVGSQPDLIEFVRSLAQS